MHWRSGRPIIFARRVPRTLSTAPDLCGITAGFMAGFTPDAGLVGAVLGLPLDIMRESYEMQ